MKPVGRPIISALRSRGYAAQAAAARADAPFSANQTQVTRLPSGITVATLDIPSPVARLAFVHNAGSRFESADNRGITHAIRSCLNLGTQNKFQVGINRGIQQLGASLSCTTSREQMIYSTEVLRSEVDEAYDILSEVAQYPAFKKHEFGDYTKKLMLEMAYLDQQPGVKMLEALHEAAYRTSLGYSLYMPEISVGNHSPDALRQFTETFYGGGNTLVIGLGVQHDDLVRKVKTNGKSGQAQPKEAAKYYGGEIRINYVRPSTDIVHAAVVSEGFSLRSGGDLLAAGVLAKALGSGPVLPYGSTRLGRSAINTDGSSAVSCVNMSYSDSGLFGVQVVAPSKQIGDVLARSVEAISDASKNITEEDVQRGRNQLRRVVATELSQGNALLEDIALQLTIGDNVTSAADVDDAISKVSLADVKKVAQKVSEGKRSMAAVGNLSNTPYLDRLV